MKLSKRLLILWIILALALAACGGDDDDGDTSSSGTGDDTAQQSSDDTGSSDGGDATSGGNTANGGDLPADAAAAFEGMEPGSYMLDVSGALTGSGGAEAYTGGDLPVDFDPAPRNTNDEGFAQLRARVDAGEDENGEPVTAEVDIRIPYGTAPGVYEVIPVDADDTSGNVQAEISGAGFGQSFNDGSEGTVTLVEFGDVLTASFAFTSRDVNFNDEVSEARVSGRVYQIPFDANPYAEFTIGGIADRSYRADGDEGQFSTQYTLDDFSGHVELSLAWWNEDFSETPEIDFVIDENLAPGEYEVTFLQRDQGGNRRLQEGQSVAALFSYDLQSEEIAFVATNVSGTLNIDIDEQGKIFGTFNITGTDDAGTEATAEGMFEYLRNESAGLFVES